MTTQTTATSQRTGLLLAGHHRLAAAKAAGLAVVPCFVHHDIGHDGAEQLVTMLVENVQRKQLTPLEKARAYGRLRDHEGLTPNQIARRTGIAVSTIHTHLALLDLDARSAEALEAGDLTAGDAIAAVRTARQEQRTKADIPARGRPVVAEPMHLTTTHPLATRVAKLCDHSTRPKVHGMFGAGCGQCWEHVIRLDERDR